jgi:type III secretion protein V
MRSANPGGRASRGFSDAALAALVLAVVGMMILPLPTPLLDVLIAGNVAAAVLMLLTAMYVRSGLEFGSFPTVLLITTLYRLALNVASTRLILLNADAGDVIRAFGEFVVGGDYLVGGVVFLVLTLIQFLVIAKGSERVAEVGARFTLDAMPGKQMSIDAELRSGGLSQDEARKRRATLQRESQFYGAMDGAMKFVKGDAIAGIVITLVNIVGGVAIGIATHGMTASESLRTFGLLTIGDGLVSQIPALLISTSAGLVVTRVASEDDGGSLGSDVAKQVFGDSRALLIAGSFLVALAIVPGLPTLPFLVLGGAFGALGLRLRRVSDSAIPSSAGATAPAHAEADARIPLVVPICIELGVDLAEELTLEEDRGAPLGGALEALRDELFVRLGLVVPALRVRRRSELDARELVVLVQEVPASRKRIPEGTPSPRHAALAAIDDAIRGRAADLVGLEETQSMLDRLERAYPALVRNVVPKPVPLSLLADVLRRLVDEGVSIRPLREILEALATHAPNERDPVELTELVRAGMRRAITHRHERDGVVRVHIVDPAVEEAVRDGIRRTPSGSYLAMPPDLARDVIESARSLVPASPEAPLVLLCQADVRRYVRRLLESDLPDVVVLSYAELAPGAMVEPHGRLSP